MKRPLFLRPEAEQDLAAARDWYDQKRAGLGHEFLNAVSLALRELDSDSEIQRLYYGNFRRMLLRRFPYKIFYQVVGDRIVIFRVLHAKREHRRNL